MKPTVGRIVLFKVNAVESRPAIVSFIDGATGRIGLHVFLVGLPAVEVFLDVAEGIGIGEWSWPPRQQ